MKRYRERSEKNLELRIAYQGEPGSFSEEAVLQLGLAIPVPCRSFAELFSAILDKRADRILAPIDNKIAGAVIECRDLLAQSDLLTIGEICLPIRLHLIGIPGSSSIHIRKVRSHPVALAQCRCYFEKHPNWIAEPATDTAGSVREILELGDRSVAAVASERAATLYGAIILDRDVHENPENFTRFLLLSAEQ
ncbi:MAG: hypothetical protein JOY62_16090 [Acidobacteriaceae bacterium]|nr:hypothetical protein [Acidobacteriaceae bacterium]MBV9781484.1 hypothetical protein [Acidobacteriaceae bacterium]